MKTYSQDLREKVVRACDEGRGTREQIAAIFGVCTAWIRRLLQRRRQTGSVAALPRGGSKPRTMTLERQAQLRALVAQQPDATLAELRDRLEVPVHLSTVGRTLVKLGLTVKKKSCGRPNRIGPTSSTKGPAGGDGRGTSTRSASSFWTKSGRTPR